MTRLHVSQTAVFGRRVRDYLEAAAPVVLHGTTCAEAVGLMRQFNASSILVANAAGQLAGIVTEQDAVQRIAFRAAKSTPVEEVMSGPVLTIRADDFLFHAIALMRRRNLRHLPVLDAGGRLAGMLHLHVALGATMPQLLGLVDRLAYEPATGGLNQVIGARVELAQALLADQIPAPEIQQLLTHINRDIYRRIVQGALADMRDAGWGEAPAQFDVLIMGSGGRGENLLAPDQDNGFILEDYDAARHNAIDTFFVELALRMTRALDAAGIRFCSGDVMATNPLWRKTLSQWRAQIGQWLQVPQPEALLNADIFFDFQTAYSSAGTGELTRALREFVNESVPKAPLFLREMVRVQGDHAVALTRFNRLATEKNDAANGPRVNLKLRGLMPLVESVRLFALRQGVSETGTLERLALLHRAGVIDDNEHDYLTEAFRHTASLVLRQQIRDFGERRQVGNGVNTDELSQREKRQLIDGLKKVRSLQERVRMEITGEVL
jgi:signal-transduction protein with cAMP-binding, CBS, and nucleotidyltransferase domain